MLSATGITRAAAVRVTEHPDGIAHTAATIRTMSELARAGSESFELRQLATRIVHEVPSKDYLAELRRLYVWVREHVRYRKDPLGLEWVQSPARTVLERAGDCDDLATLIASLAGALGHQWRFVTVGPRESVQLHIAAEVSPDGVHWITLDPVMEPRRASTEVRTDAGAFGRVPPGVTTRHWNNRGAPMSGLGFTPSAELKSLWSWQPYFPQFAGYPLPPSPAPHVAYRSSDAPGARTNIPIAVMSGMGGMGCVGCAFGATERAWASGAVRRGELDARTVQRWRTRGVMGDEPVLLLLDDDAVNRSQLDGLGGYPHRLGSIWGSLKKIGKGIGKAAKGVVRTVGRAAVAVGKSPVGKIVAPVLALNTDPKLRKIRDAVMKQLPAGATLLKVGTAGERLASRFAAKPKSKPLAVVRPGQKPIVVRAAKPASRPTHWKLPHPEIAQRYPRGSRQSYDARAQVFRVYAPRAGRLGAIIPTVTLAFGAQATAADNVVAFVSEIRPAAAAAVAAVNKWIKSRADHRPPAKAIAEVLAFQQRDAARGGSGTLKTDGLWGTNTRDAAAYYLGQPSSSLPPVLPPLQIARTWQPPTAPSPVRAAPSSSPTPVRPSAPSSPAPVRPSAPSSSSSSAPAAPGLIEVGTEPLNPGLPPVGAPASAAASSAPGAIHAIPFAPAPGFAPAPTTAPAMGPTQLLTTATVPPLPINRPAPGSVLNLPPPLPPGAMYAQQAAPLPPAMLPPPPLPAGPGYAPGPVLAPDGSSASGGSSSGGSLLPWLALAYCMRRQSS